MAKKHIFKVVFHNQGKIYELHCGRISQSDMYAFVEISDIIFGERTAVVVDPSEERMKSEFEGVKRTYIPMHAIIRIDEVSKGGTNKIVGTTSGDSNVTPFPMPIYTPGGDSS